MQQGAEFWKSQSTIRHQDMQFLAKLCSMHPFTGQLQKTTSLETQLPHHVSRTTARCFPVLSPWLNMQKINQWSWSDCAALGTFSYLTAALANHVFSRTMLLVSTLSEKLCCVLPLHSFQFIHLVSLFPAPAWGMKTCSIMVAYLTLVWDQTDHECYYQSSHNPVKKRESLFSSVRYNN